MPQQKFMGDSVAVDCFDFFSENSKSFYKKLKTESVPLFGSYDAAAEVTIILTTNNRPNLLKISLESALHQVGNVGYNIIVADNEGASIDCTTDTSRTMEQYRDKGVLYYRHKQSTNQIVDSAARLAKTRWIVFLHDDDFLSPYHLLTMTSIVKKYPKIRFLSSVHQRFLGDGIPDISQIENNRYKYSIMKESKYANCFGFYGFWQGALIDRESYIQIGGMPSINTGLGDYCMVEKFHNKFGVYKLDGDYPLYYYRMWKHQASSKGGDYWKGLYKNEYYYHKYVSKYYHKLSHAFWDRISSYRIVGKAVDMLYSAYGTRVPIEELVSEAQMEEDWIYKTNRYKKDIVKKDLYEYIIQKLFRRYFRGEIDLNDDAIV